MNEEWQSWTRTNLEAGCAPEEIFQRLINKGFDFTSIRKTMTSVLSEDEFAAISGSVRDQDSGRNPSLDYQSLAKPSLVQREADNDRLSRVEDDRIQLYTLDDFLSDTECDELIAIINSSLKPSKVTAGDKYQGYRTSSTCHLVDKNTGCVKTLEERISKTLGISLQWSEPNQGQKYLVGQEFKAHTDYFQPGTEEFTRFASKSGQRTWTFMVYLNNTPKGGATYFTQIDKLFLPQKGRAVIWNNLNADGSVNPYTQHHGMPVEEGEKIIITKWFRDKGERELFV